MHAGIHSVLTCKLPALDTPRADMKTSCRKYALCWHGSFKQEPSKQMTHSAGHLPNLRQ
jgi:hypothetical protein